MEQLAKRGAENFKDAIFVAKDFFRETLFSKQKKDKPLSVTIEFPTIQKLDVFTKKLGSHIHVAWDSGDRQKAFSMGAAIELKARGKERFTTIQNQADEIFQTLEQLRQNSKMNREYPLRFFSGFEFHNCQTESEGKQVEKLWDAFGEARAWLPRWLFLQEHDQASLTFTTTSLNNEDSEKAMDELELLFSLAEREEPLSKLPTFVSQSHMAEEEWKSLIGNAKSDIKKERLSKVVLGRYSKIEFDQSITPAFVFSNLGNHTSSCTKFLFQMDGLGFVGATPETLVKKEGKKIFTEALAGTKKTNHIGSSDEEGPSLTQDEKERHEHDLVVREIQKSLSPVCEELHIEEKPSIQKLKHMEHLRTNIEGEVDEKIHVLELVEKLHPTPAVAGAPREEAIEWICKNEKEKRGWFSGPIGWFDQEGNGEFLVALRSALIHKNEVWIWAGAGIVEGSEAEKEYKETTLKMQPILNALGITEIEKFS